MARLPAIISLFADRARTAFPPFFFSDADTDPGGWRPDTSARRVARGVTQYLKDRVPADERARFQSVVRVLRRTPVVDAGEHIDLYLWLTSFLLYGRFCEACEVSWEDGERLVLSILPPVVQINLAFFLGQWWVRGLMQIWHEQKEDGKIEQVLLRSPGRGKGSWVEQHLLRQRDWVIFKTVEELRRDGLGYNAALRCVHVQRQNKAFGDFPIISRNGLRTVYDRLYKQCGPLFPKPRGGGAEIAI